MTDTVFNLIRAHTPISVRQFRSVQNTAHLLLSTSLYVVFAHLNCLKWSRQIKSVPTTFAFINKKIIRKLSLKASSNVPLKSSADLSLKGTLISCKFFYTFFL